jgi:calcineurin-like phosphoesterase family protein
MKIWIISDTHFNHINIIKYCNRPFNTVEEMNDTLIKNWNKNILKKDLVYHLGDFSFYNNDSSSKILKKLNGRKRLILGNHDIESNNYYRKIGFEEVYEFPIILSEFYILSHKPIYLNNTMPYINIHGHIHSNEIICFDKDNKNHYFNACVENNNYSPILLNDICKKY